MAKLMDPNSENRLSKVHPVLADKIRQLSDILAKEGIVIRVTQGLRTWQEQDVLYAKGRTTLGPKVTNAAGGYSWHNFGLAVDVVPDIAGAEPFQPDWNVGHPAWKRIVEVGTSLGLNSGATWRSFKDYPHLQLTGTYPIGAPTEDCRQLAKSNGLDLTPVWEVVTAALDSINPPVQDTDDKEVQNG